MKCCLKTKNSCLKTQIKHAQSYCERCRYGTGWPLFLLNCLLYFILFIKKAFLKLIFLFVNSFFLFWSLDLIEQFPSSFLTISEPTFQETNKILELFIYRCKFLVLNLWIPFSTMCKILLLLRCLAASSQMLHKFQRSPMV